MHRRSLTIFRPYANEQSGSKSNHWLWRQHEKWKAGAKKSHYFCCLRNLNALCNNWMAFSTLFSGGSTADKLSRKNNKPSLDWQNEKKHIRHSQTTTHSEPKAMTQPQWLKFTSALQIMSFVGSVWTRRTKPEVCHWEACGWCSKQLVSSHNDHQKETRLCLEHVEDVTFEFSLQCRALESRHPHSVVWASLLNVL